MSLSWKKRQAIASDQKTWRGLGLDSALWTSIERNSGNVKTALTGSGNKTEGIVTGLSFYNNGGSTGYNTTTKNTIYVSDASNVSISPAVALAKNSGETAYDASMNCTGSGLIFNIGAFGAFNSVGGQDISGVKYGIIDGGSGYTVGNTIGIGNLPPFNGTSTQILATITSVTSTDPEQGRN